MTHLSLTNGPEMQLDFEGGVAPLLQACGSRLTGLVLCKFASVDAFGSLARPLEIIVSIRKLRSVSG